MSDQTIPGAGDTEMPGSADSRAGSSVGSASSPAPEPPPRPSVIDAVIDLLQTIVDYLRQEADDIMQSKIVQPLQKLGGFIGSGMAAGCLAGLGLAFIAVALLLLLAGWLGWPGALGLIGAVLLIGSIVFLVIKARNFQKPKPEGAVTGSSKKAGDASLAKRSK